ncbi:MAG: GNAT family N-acetyltransferase [Butyrivibrio sp.]|nr:GNAT family N-acetyltransferase [Butyrivibrio sp.]
MSFFYAQNPHIWYTFLEVAIVLNSIFFIYENEIIVPLVQDESAYVVEQGYSSAVFEASKFPEDDYESHKKTILIATDSQDKAKELSEKGFYVIGIAHAENISSEFKGLKYIFTDISEVDIDSFVKAYQRYAGEPWEVLKTERLIVRETTLEDVDEFYKLYADPEMTRYMEGLFENPEDEKRYQKDYIDKVYGLMGFGVWTVVRKSDGVVVGRAGFSVRNGFDDIELGFLIGKEYQRQGYAMEVCSAILDYGKAVLQFDKVQTLVKAENKVSIHICEKLGFEKTDTVEVEENIYGQEYNAGQKVPFNECRHGTYVRMIKFLW